MACRVARSSHDERDIDIVYCSECGSSNLEVFYTSRTLGPHLCSICVQATVECGVGEVSKMRPSKNDRVPSEI